MGYADLGELDPALFVAAKEGDVAAVRDLIERGANPMATDGRGWDALMHAVCVDNEAAAEELARFLLPLSDARRLSEHRPQPIGLADQFISRCSALMMAATFGRAACVEMLLPFSDVDARDSREWNALALAGANKNKNNEAGAAACVRLLAPVSSHDPVCWTAKRPAPASPLIIALREGRGAATIAAMATRERILAVDGEGANALVHAVWGGRDDCAQIIADLAEPADFAIACKKGYPLNLAVRSKWRQLACAYAGRASREALEFFDAPEDFGSLAPKTQRGTPLMAAIQEKLADVVAALARRAQHKTTRGHTAFWYAAHSVGTEACVEALAPYATEEDLRDFFSVSNRVPRTPDIYPLACARWEAIRLRESLREAVAEASEQNPSVAREAAGSLPASRKPKSL
jgi:hypothetical protein